MSNGLGMKGSGIERPLATPGAPWPNGPELMIWSIFMRHDAIIIGGSFAGLSAAMSIARARRSVCIIDTGSPRNRFAARSHGFFTQDGSAPGAMLATARSQAAAYPTAAFIAGQALSAVGEPDGFSVTLATGDVLESAKLVLAFGVSDELPAIPGLAERWGTSVLHCPYCHGFEVSGQRLGVLHVSPRSLHQAMLIADWGPTTLYLNVLPSPMLRCRPSCRSVGSPLSRRQ
jgi:thioredoxin reductase